MGRDEEEVDEEPELAETSERDARFFKVDDREELEDDALPLLTVSGVEKETGVMANGLCGAWFTDEFTSGSIVALADR